MREPKVWRKNEMEMELNMKYYIAIIVLWAGMAQAFAQQPRLKQADEYLAMTGQPDETKKSTEKQCNLLGTLYGENKRLILNLPDLQDVGTREVMPFGYKLNRASEVELTDANNNQGENNNLTESSVRTFFNKSIFSGVSYQLCDSVVYGITLFYDDHQHQRRAVIEKNLLRHFQQADYELEGVSVYSDPDYAVRLLPDKVEIYSLFHFPSVETLYPGVSHKVWYGPCRYETDGSSLMLAFYNQETKENNIQSAFNVSYKYPAGTSFKMTRIRFMLDDQTFEFPLEIEYTDISDDGKTLEERNTRTFLFPEELKAITRSQMINVELIGEEGQLLYKMPEFQRASAYTAYEYFRWNVTNPMIKYTRW